MAWRPPGVRWAGIIEQGECDVMDSDTERDFWQMLEDAPAACEAVSDLFHWSTNYPAGEGPAALFLDMIGYSADEFGGNLWTQRFEVGLGYVEISKLAAALTEYAERPQDVREWIYELMQAEAQS